MRPLLFASASLLLAAPALAQDPSPQPAPQIDYNSFLALTAELAPYRQSRLLPAQAFFARATDGRALLLDTRSAADFQRGHIEGAVNLPFSEFTDEALRAVIGEDKTRPILIYCNNNFSDNVAPIKLKRAPLALNIPTFINLYGYGYENIWELHGTLATKDVEQFGKWTQRGRLSSDLENQDRLRSPSRIHQ